MNIKAWRIHDRMRFFVDTNKGLFVGVGKVIARYPATSEVDLMDQQGHVWRVASGNYGR